ncbi:MAG: thioesterase [Thermoguttaceae bacterium]|nr:thioesterase [Thermoguttaceae bacterium]
MVGIFTRKYEIRINEIGPDERLTPQTMFCYLQDISNAQVASMGIGVDDLKLRGVTWVLSRVCLETAFLPRHGDTIVAQTWPAEPARFFVPRHVLLTSQETGEKVAHATCFWLMLDMATKTVVHPWNHYPKVDVDDFGPVFFANPQRLDNSPGTSPLEFTARNSYIDFNRHVNNRFYFSFAQDWLSEIHAAPVQIDTIQINFNLPLAFGESLVCSGETNGPRFRVVGYSADDRNVFSAAGTFAIQ